MRTEKRTDAERKMMSKIERESRRKISGRESADTGNVDAMHCEKKKYPCTYSDGLNARRLVGMCQTAEGEARVRERARNASSYL